MIAVTDATVLAASGAVGAVAAALGTGLLVRRRTAAESADIISQAAERLVKRYEAHVESLELRLEQVEHEWRSCQAQRHEDRLLIEQQQVQIDELHRMVERLTKGDE